METAAVDSPPSDENLPVEPEPPADESAQARHARELNQSVDALEDTIEKGVARGLGQAIPVVLGVFVACVGLYVVGRRLRHRAQARRAARAR